MEKQTEAVKAKTGMGDYTRTMRLNRIVHIIAPTGEKSKHRFEAISGERATAGRVEYPRCTPEMYRQIKGTSDAKTIRPGLRGRLRHFLLARCVEEKNGDTVEPVAVGFDLIPMRYFIHHSGPVECKTARKEGMILEWIEDYKGFRIDNAELGMSQRDLETVLDEIRKKMGARRNLKTSNGYEVTRIDEATLRVKNPKPYVEPTI